jgi:hypothetical protein
VRPALIVIAAFAVITTLLAWSRWLVGRRWAAAGHLLLAFVAGAAVILAWPVMAYVKQFVPLTASLPVAELAFERTGADRHRITVTRLPSGQMQLLEVTGGEWRADLQVLRWAGWLAPFAPQTAYRIRALETRMSAEASAVVTHRLDSPAGNEPWAAGLGTRGGGPALVVQPVASRWLPMGDRVRYELRLSQTGSVAVVPRGEAGLRPPGE